MRSRKGRKEENTCFNNKINHNFYKRESKLSFPEESESPSTDDPPLAARVCVNLCGVTSSSLSEEAYLDVTAFPMRTDAAFRRAR